MGNVIAKRIEKRRLRSVVPKDVPVFSLKDLGTYARVSNVYDGDTLHLTIRLDSKFHRFRCRLEGIDTPEMKGSSNSEKYAACVARDYLRSLIDDQIVWAEFGAMDKYGRPLVSIFKDRLYVNKHMIDKGHAVTYDGGKKKEWTNSSGIVYPTF
jgi:endonuclease YncB( thermonuclease family)